MPTNAPGYPRLPVADLASYEGIGIFYAATRVGRREPSRTRASGPAYALPMEDLQATRQHLISLHWPLVVGLGALALVRPLMSIVGLMDELGRPLAPLLATLVISVVWIAVVGLSRVPEPVLTLVFAGLVYAGLSIALSAILSAILTGELQGPLATPFGTGVLSVLVVNALWGAVTGAIALLVRRMRGADATVR
jgi:hypothetical protein